MISYADPRGGDQQRQMLIDTGPELREQMTRHRIHRIDGVMYTHAHADHIFGLDDLRRFNAVMRQPIEIFAEPTTMATIQQVFFYIFQKHANINQSFIADLAPRPLAEGSPIELYGARWTPIRLMHGRLPILGYRVDYQGASLAYCTDVSTIPPESYEVLADLDVLVIDALRYRHHPTHLSVDQALAYVEQFAPRRAYFTHIAHDILHADLAAKLPENVLLSHDGLVVKIAGRKPGDAVTAGPSVVAEPAPRPADA